MIGALEGKIIRKTSDYVILMTEGVGYQVCVPMTMLETLPLNVPTFLHVHTHVREDALRLYGFKTAEELRLFEFLLAVSGIGPKTALTIVDRGVAPTQHAIRSSDVEFFTSIPRLGKKNAQKVIIELKNKLGAGTDFDFKNSGETQDLVEAMSSVGFSRSEVISILKDIPKEAVSLEQKMKSALRLLGKKR